MSNGIPVKTGGSNGVCQVNPDFIPDELKGINQWVVWNWGLRPDGDGKLTKLPIDPKNRQSAKTNDPDTWGSFEQALQCHKNMAVGGGVGFVFTSNDDYCGIDVDKCRDKETGEMSETAKNILASFPTYAEVSPSGTGVKLLFRGKMPEGRNRKNGIEMYDRGRFFTVTGDVVDDHPLDVVDCQQPLNALHKQLFGDGKKDIPSFLQPKGTTTLGDHELLARIRKSKQGAKFDALWRGECGVNESRSEADLALVNLLMFWCGGDTSRVDSLFRQSGLYRDKWERKDYREATFDTALSNRDGFYDPEHNKDSKKGFESFELPANVPDINIGDIATLYDLEAAGAGTKYFWDKWIQSDVVNLFASPGGLGKCFQKGTGILMFDGTTKRVEDVVVGDKIMGPDSKPRNVLSLCRGKEMMYRVTPVKGDSYVVNESHVLSLKNNNLGKGMSKLVEMTPKQFMEMDAKKRKYYVSWRTGVEFSEKPIAIDPYFLGIWLGDGDCKAVVIHKPDKEIESYVKWYANHLKLKFHKYGKKQCPAYSISKVTGEKRGNPILKELQRLGLIRNKHVPYEYKCNTRDVRAAVLAGILDTDGSLTVGGYDYISKDKQLAEDVVYLCRSLGLAAYISKCNKSCKTLSGMFVGEYWRVSISGDCTFLPMKIERKKSPPRKQVKNVLHTGISVEAIGEDDYYGFSIDGDHLFLLSDFTVTHNSRCLLDIIRRIKFGLPWPDGQPMHIDGKEFRSLWVLADNHHNQMVSVGRKWDIMDKVWVSAYKSNPFDGTMLETNDDLLSLFAIANTLKPHLVVVDTVGGSTAKNLAKQEDAMVYYNPLMKMARELQCPFICICHVSANGQVYGIRSRERARSVIQMAQPNAPEDEKRRLWVEKSTDAKPPALGMYMTEDGAEYDDDPPELPEGYGNSFAASQGKQGSSKPKQRVSRQHDCNMWLWDWLSRGETPVDMVDKVGQRKGYKKDEIDKALATVNPNIKDDGEAKYFYLPPNTPAPQKDK